MQRLIGRQLLRIWPSAAAAALLVYYKKFLKSAGDGEIQRTSQKSETQGRPRRHSGLSLNSSLISFFN
jgi:hypothetical protein